MTLWEADRERRGHLLLANPGSHPDLPWRDPADVWLRFWAYPSLSPYMSWAVIDGEDEYRARRIVWDRPADRLGGHRDPTTYGAEAPLAREAGDVLIRDLESILVPAFVLEPPAAPAGETRGIEYRRGQCSARLEWWFDAPERWRAADEWFDRAVAALDRALSPDTR